jgi:hypothetical protein
MNVRAATPPQESTTNAGSSRAHPPFAVLGLYDVCRYTVFGDINS